MNQQGKPYEDVAELFGSIYACIYVSICVDVTGPVTSTFDLSTSSDPTHHGCSPLHISNSEEVHNFAFVLPSGIFAVGFGYDGTDLENFVKSGNSREIREEELNYKGSNYEVFIVFLQIFFFIKLRV